MAISMNFSLKHKYRRCFALDLEGYNRLVQIAQQEYDKTYSVDRRDNTTRDVWITIKYPVYTPWLEFIKYKLGL